MSGRKKKKSNKRNSKKEKGQEVPAIHLRTSWKFPKVAAIIPKVTFIISVVWVVSGWTQWQWFIPRLSVEPTFQQGASILTTMFQVKNDGNVRLRKVEVAYAPCLITDSNNGRVDGDCISFKSLIKEPNSDVNRLVKALERGEGNTIAFPSSFNLGPNVNYADFAFVFSYKTEWWPFQFQERYRFRTAKDDKSQLQWVSEPINK